MSDVMITLKLLDDTIISKELEDVKVSRYLTPEDEEWEGTFVIGLQDTQGNFRDSYISIELDDEDLETIQIDQGE